jgi:hypothetical protein
MILRSEWFTVVALQGLMWQLQAACSSCMTWLLWTLLQAQLWSYCRVSPFLLGKEKLCDTQCLCGVCQNTQCCLLPTEGHGSNSLPANQPSLFCLVMMISSE